MSESMNQVPKLNEIMEEYITGDEETNQVAQAETRRSEERAEVNNEPKQLVEESRKKKKGD